MKFRLERLRSITSLIKELSTGLRKLSFSENFQSFEVTVDIPATSELGIRNQLTFIPTKYIIVSQTGAGQVTKGTTDWSSDFVYLYNNGGSTVTVTVVFLR